MLQPSFVTTFFATTSAPNRAMANKEFKELDQELERLQLYKIELIQEKKMLQLDKNDIINNYNDTKNDIINNYAQELQMLLLDKIQLERQYALYREENDNGIHYDKKALRIHTNWLESLNNMNVFELNQEKKRLNNDNSQYY